MNNQKSEKPKAKKCQKHIININQIMKLLSEDIENNLTLERIKSINKTINLSSKLIMKYYTS